MNRRQIEADLSRLHRLNRVLHKGKQFVLPEGAISHLDLIERRLLEAVRRDETGDVIRDGYPSGNVGSGGEDASQSSTEAAVMAGYDNDGHPRLPEHDRHHELTSAACFHLQAASDAVASLLANLDAIDALATVPRSDPSGWCNACGRFVEGTAVDRVRAGYCPACYRAWLRDGKPDRLMFERTRQSAA